MIVEVAIENVQIRLATANEAEKIAEVIREAFGPLQNSYTPEAFLAVTPAAGEIRGRFDEGPIWVAIRSGEMVATVSTMPEPDWLYIRSMAVLPRAQGLGIGHKLLAAIEEYAIKNGFERLYLYTTYFLTDAIRLYEKHGFAVERETTAAEWYGIPGLAMDKKISRNIKQNVAGS